MPADSLPFELTTAVLLRELAGGTCIAQSVVEPKLASIGSEEDVLAEFAMFLREYFQRARPDVLARFAVPAETRLIEVPVVVPREDLPHRIACTTPITIAAIVLPAGRDAWVSVPALDHFVFVGRDEDLDKVVGAEVRRIAGARDLSPYEIIRLLPASAHRLERITVELETRAGIRGEGGVSMRKRISEHARREKAVHALASAGTPLHHEARKNLPPLVAREKELAELTLLLSGRERLGALLVGPEDSGKSALVRAWLSAEMAKGHKQLVYQTSGAQLIAGMSGFGQWQERIKSVMEAAEAIDAILYFEDLADLLSERSEGGVDLTGAMKPFLRDNKVRVLAELRPDSLDHLERKNPAFFTSLHKIKVEGLDAARALEALELRAAHDARHEPERPEIDAKAIPVLVDLAERYLPYGVFPGKAIRLYEDLRAVREGDSAQGGGQAGPILADHVHDLFAIQTGVPAFLLRESSPLPASRVEEALARQLIGQREAVKRLAETIAVVKAGLQPKGKPLATFLFVGPTGVGKTELARSLAQFLFGSPEAMARFDMSEFMSADAAERLIRGTDRDAGLLTQRVREQPFCVVLLDEIEKAHPAVFDLLLQVAGEGRLTDARGKTASFQNAILIMTSNLGAAERRAPLGISPGGQAARDEVLHYQRHVESSFRQELINRLDRIIVFRSLTQPEIRAVAKIAVAKINARPGLVDLGVVFDVSDAALDRLAEGGYSPAFGARALRRHLEEALVAVASRMLGKLGHDLKGTLGVVTAVEENAKTDGSVVAESEADGLRVQLKRRKAAKTARDLRGAHDVANLRRWVDRAMALSAVTRVKERIDAITTELALVERGTNDKRKKLDMSELLAEHHRLDDLWKRARSAQEDLRSCEELAITTLFGGEPVEPLLDEARSSLKRFRAALPYLFVALETDRNQITLCLEELDTGAFELWLPYFFGLVDARKWRAEVHIDGGAKKPGEVWTSHARWGPPRSTGEVLKALAEPKRSFKNLLFRCSGAYAGSFLLLEKGLHRIAAKDISDDGRANVFVHYIASRSAIAADEWGHDSLLPPPIETASARRKGQAAREFDLGGVIKMVARRITLEGTVETFFGDYESFALEQLLLREREEDED